MKITITPEGVRFEAENNEDIFNLGQISAKIRDSRHFRMSDGAHVVITPGHSLLRLVLEACKA